jgi:hypothetical protein
MFHSPPSLGHRNTVETISRRIDDDIPDYNERDSIHVVDGVKIYTWTSFVLLPFNLFLVEDNRILTSVL